jgi:butyrate kinase
MRWVLAHQHDQAALQRKLTGQGGLVAYLGTNDFPSIERSADAEGGLDGALCHGLIDALCYQVAKSIAALSAFTCGRIDAIVLTGGIASSGRAVREISNRVSFLAPVMVFPGENELEALAMGVREVLMGHSSALTYQG